MTPLRGFWPVAPMKAATTSPASSPTFASRAHACASGSRCAFGASIWLGLFAYRHVEYADTLWWQFALEHDVSRWLRASVGAAVALSAFGAMRLLRPAPPLAAPPSDEDLVDAARVIDRQSHTMAQLVFLRDKSLIFDADRNAFLMYGVQGRSWVALGDPVGDPAAAPGLVRSFVERAADAGGTPVFYQVRPDCLHVYADMGMSFTKLGEEARVSLADFSLEGGAHRGQRNTLSQLARQGLRFRVLPPDDVPARLPELKAMGGPDMGMSTAQIGETIRWNEDPVGYDQWPIAFNRHSHWVTLGRAYELIGWGVDQLTTNILE